MLAVWQRLTVKKQELSTADAHMSEIVIHVGPFSQGDTPFFGLDAYLDATFQSGASGVRFLTCWREESGWRVERDVTLRPKGARTLSVICPTFRCRGQATLQLLFRRSSTSYSI
jgi:hypothetical protein